MQKISSKSFFDMLPMWEYSCPTCGTYAKPDVLRCPNCLTAFNPMVWRVPPRKKALLEAILWHFFVLTYTDYDKAVEDFKALKFEDAEAVSKYAHEFLAPKLTDEQRELMFKYFTVLFESGWENSGGTDITDGGAWTGTSDVGGYLSVQGVTVHHGNYAAKITNAPSMSTADVYKTITAQSHVFTRAYFRLEALPDADGRWVCLIAIGQAASWYPMAVYVEHDGTSAKWCLRNNYFGGIYWGSEVSAGQWYCVELESYKQLLGPISLYVNGTLEGTVTQSAALDPDTVRVGAPFTNIGAGVYGFTYTGEIDCAVIADAYIGPEEVVPKPKGTIAIHAKVAGVI